MISKVWYMSSGKLKHLEPTLEVPAKSAFVGFDGFCWQQGDLVAYEILESQRFHNPGDVVLVDNQEELAPPCSTPVALIRNGEIIVAIAGAYIDMDTVMKQLAAQLHIVYA